MYRGFLQVMAILGAALTASQASAQSIPPEVEETLKRIASENLRRIRRGVAFGPHLGASGNYLAVPNQMDGGVSFGLGLYLFNIPTTFDLRDLVIHRARHEITARVKQLTDEGRPPSGAELESLIRAVYREALDEILGKNRREDKTLERPRFGFIVEGQRLFRSEAWQVRFVPSLGISFLSIGPTLTLHTGARTTGLLGGELSVRLLPEGGPRSRVIEIFGRAELSLGHKDTVGTHAGGGVRLLFDLL
ncbi:MAG: hypothetical protein RMJ98_00700 [Myxococcales bacterium]|nr:hypothetical protein [Polyangiaceae bacterium]MDW8247804.1 hypothetical protein [Myxococcales bacterium]